MEDQTDEGSRVRSRKRQYFLIRDGRLALTSCPECVMCRAIVRTVERRLEYLECPGREVHAGHWSVEDDSPAWLISLWNFSLTKICRLFSFNVDQNDASLLSRRHRRCGENGSSTWSYRRLNSSGRCSPWSRQRAGLREDSWSMSVDSNRVHTKPSRLRAMESTQLDYPLEDDHWRSR